MDGAGNSYVVGHFGSVEYDRDTSATFGLGEINETTLESLGERSDSDSIFIAKYSSEGELVWAKSAQGEIGHGTKPIAIDGWGNTYLTGYFGYPSTFGVGEPNETTLTSSAGHVFIAKYNSDGTLGWVRRSHGANARGRSVAVDGVGNSYVIGSMGGRLDIPNEPMIFGAGETTEVALPTSESHDIFVVKYDIHGAPVSASRAGGIYQDTPYGIAVDDSGSAVCHWLVWLLFEFPRAWNGYFWARGAQRDYSAKRW